MSRAKQILLVAAIMMTGLLGAAAFSPAPVSAGNPNQCQPGQPCDVEICKAGDPCDSFINTYVNPLVTFLTVSIGILAAISVVVAGIQYASAGDDPSKVQKAKSRIGQTILGVIAYLFLFAFLNYLIPGGLIP